jgi:hypothetical protein
MSIYRDRMWVRNCNIMMVEWFIDGLLSEEPLQP